MRRSLFIATTIAGSFDSLLFQPKKDGKRGGEARVVVFIPSAVLWLLWRLSEGGGDEWWVVFAAEAADHP